MTAADLRQDLAVLMRRLDVALTLVDLAAEPGDFLDFLRSIERKFPTLTFSDFVAAMQMAETGARQATVKAEARRQLH